MIAFLWLSLALLPVAAAPKTETALARSAASNYEEGKRLMDGGRLDEALPYLERAVRDNPKHEPAQLQLAALYIEMGRQSSAERSFQSALKANPRSAAALRELGRIHEQRGQYDLALEEYRRYAELRPRDPEPQWGLGRVYLALSLQNSLEGLRKSPRPAADGPRERLRGLLSADARDPLLRYFQGVMDLNDGKPLEAAVHFEEAAGLSPDFRLRAALQLAPIYVQQDRPEEAARQYGVLAEIDRDDIVSAREAGRLKAQIGDLAAAEDFFRRVWSVKPSAQLARELGDVLVAMRRFDAASELYSQVAAKDQPELRWSLAQAYKKDREYTLALREFESLMGRYPNRAALEREIHDVTQLRLEAATPVADRGTGVEGDVREIVVPEALIALAEGQYALLVDKSTQTLALYRGVRGDVEHVKTFACSTGENDGEKLEMGDKKTPEGIYQFTEVKTAKELPAIYGKLAFPMDYPNFFDQRQGKNGSGIWLHSTDEPIRALLPQKTRGCIVVNDPVIEELAKKIRLFDTPIVVARTLRVAGPDARTQARRELEDLLDEWRDSWQAKDLERYLALYSATFQQRDMDLAAWRSYKEAIFRKAGRITVRTSLRHLLKHEDQAVAAFRQDYTADAHSDSGIKRLFLVRENGLWRIVGEEWRPL